MYADRWDNFNGDSTLGSAPVASSAAATAVSFNNVHNHSTIKFYYTCTITIAMCVLTA